MKRILTAVLLLCAATSFAQNKEDIFVFRALEPESCCFELDVENAHTPASPINTIQLRLITPGAKFHPGAGGAWPTQTESDSLIIFGDGNIEIRSGEMVDGFNFCVHFLPGQPRQFQLEWLTKYNTTVTSIDTVDLECIVIQRTCDSVLVSSITIPNQPDGSCCYDFTLRNVHEPPSELNGFRLMLQTPGASIVGDPSGPWQTSEVTSTSVTFTAPGDVLPTGEELRNFRICVATPQGDPGDVVIRWISLNFGQILCEEDIVVNCVPKFRPRSDTLLLRPRQDCGYDLGFINTHQPRSTINTLRLSVLTPGAGLAAATAPTGWMIASQTTLNVQFTNNGNPVATGDSAKGFLVTFKPSSSGVVRFSWTTYDGSTVATRDTVQVQCTPPPPVVCDSVLVVPQANSCSYDFGFVNAHLPASDVNEFALRLQNPGATIADAVAPENWVIQTRSATDIVFKDTAGVIVPGAEQTGFILALTPADAGDVIGVEYSTGRDGNVNCSEIVLVACRPAQERCDSLSVTPSMDYCGYTIDLTNLRIPEAPLDAWRLELDDPAAVLLAATAPTGWSVDTLDEQMVRFTLDAGSLATGASAGGFALQFVPSSISSQIPFTWTTELAGQDRCADTASVACELKIVQCDMIDVVTSVERPCCFEFSVQNTHLPRGIINGFNVQILTPGVTLFTSTIEDPDGWTNIRNSTRVGWRTDGGIPPGENVSGFTVCYDNSAIGNADFQVVIQTVENGLIICEDTVTIKCDRTLRISALPGAIPNSVRLHQNFPNPFNPVTTITFDLPRPDDVTLSLYDPHGRLVMDLGSGSYEAGSWQIRLDASSLRSGTYFYQLRTSAHIETRSLILLK